MKITALIGVPHFNLLTNIANPSPCEVFSPARFFVLTSISSLILLFHKPTSTPPTLLFSICNRVQISNPVCNRHKSKAAPKTRTAFLWKLFSSDFLP